MSIDEKDFDDLRKNWTERATKEFKGKKVKSIEWLTKDEVKQSGWFHAAPVIMFEDGSYMVAQMDDEGNDAGALATSSKTMPILPVI